MADLDNGQPEFFDALAEVVVREVPGATGLLDVERLSGGASMETYRLTVSTADGPRPICMRRGAGGVNREAETAIGLDVEALHVERAVADVADVTVEVAREHRAGLEDANLARLELPHLDAGLREVAAGPGQVEQGLCAGQDRRPPMRVVPNALRARANELGDLFGIATALGHAPSTRPSRARSRPP